MSITMSTEEEAYLSVLEKTRRDNFEILRYYSLYLSEFSTFITAEMVEELKKTCNLNDEAAYYLLLCGALGLDVDRDERDRRLAMTYLRPGIKKMEPWMLTQDPYYHHIVIPEDMRGRWALKTEVFTPYEAFVRDDIRVGADLVEIPQIGFFTREIPYPAVLENGNEWMMITPEETATLRGAIARARGQVITFGLGLGYYVYMVSNKEEVEAVTVVEWNKIVIDLFKKDILPQLPHREKVVIIHGDAFEYAAKEMGKKTYHYALVDTWHDVSDGYDMYLKMKVLEKYSPGTHFDYWIEASLLSHLRWQVYYALMDALKGKATFWDNLPKKRWPKLINLMEFLGNKERLLSLIPYFH